MISALIRALGLQIAEKLRMKCLVPDYLGLTLSLLLSFLQLGNRDIDMQYLFNKVF